MWRREMPFALWAILTLGCGDDGTLRVDPGFDPGPNPAGSCNHTTTGLCDEYARAEASDGLPMSCEVGGGTWSSSQCPLDGRLALCTTSSSATRTYSYTQEAASSLQSTCPAEDFVQLEMPTPVTPPPTDMMDDEDAGA